MKAPTMRPALRWALGAVALLTAVVAWLPEEEAAVVRPTTAARAMPAPRSTMPEAPSRQTAQPAEAPYPGASAGHWPAPGPAALAAWRAAPRPAAARPAPVAAVPEGPAPPPAVPYQWVGQIEEDGHQRFFLADAQGLWPVSQGETLASGWRVDGLRDGQLQLTWLATGAAVTLSARP